MRRLSSILVAMSLAVLPATALRAQDAVKIGVLNDQSGNYAEFGGLGSVEAARMAIEDFGGTVLGKPIEFVAADHQNKPDIAAALARRWYDADGVTAIADLTNSAVALAVAGIANERKKVALFNGPATTRLFNEDCFATGFMWTFDTATSAKGTALSVLKEGGDSWYIIAADYAFGHQLSADIQAIVNQNGGKTLGSVRHPLGSADFASYLLQAQASKAKIVAFANAGTDTINSIKQAGEFGIVDAGQKIAAMVIVLSDVKGLGLDKAKGLITTTAYYHDRDKPSRDWADRYLARTKSMPGMIQASVYSSVLHYLRAVKAAGTASGPEVAAKMKEMPVDDFFAPGAKIRADGRLMNDMYLAEVKAPAESKNAWDFFKIVRSIPAADIIAPLSESKCSLVKP
jgi:branched-chain amino acid transport system substrate-binding protein